MQVCTKCRESKALDDFYLLATGCRRRECKACCSAYAKGRPAYQYEPNADKRCSRCLAVKKNTEFARNKNSKLGTRSWCKACFSEYSKADNKARYAADPDAALRRSGEWAARNGALILANHRANRARDPKLYNSSRSARYQRERSAVGPGISAEQWAEILEIHDHRCAYCLRKIAPLQLDHVIALARGGEHHADNAVPACVSCNSSKRDKAMFEILNPRLLVAQRSV